MTGGELYGWNDQSTYIQEPPFLIDLTARGRSPIGSIARGTLPGAVGRLGDHRSHFPRRERSPGTAPPESFLQAAGVEPRDFNSYGSRRGNDRVMTRGTFANIRIRNQLAPGTEGGVTRYLPIDCQSPGAGEVMSIYDASMKYQETGTPLVVLAGAEYGTGSSRDWAAKGTFLLGVRAVIAASYERIHRQQPRDDGRLAARV